MAAAFCRPCRKQGPCRRVPAAAAGFCRPLSGRYFHYAAVACGLGRARKRRRDDAGKGDRTDSVSFSICPGRTSEFRVRGRRCRDSEHDIGSSHRSRRGRKNRRTAAAGHGWQTSRRRRRAFHSVNRRTQDDWATCNFGCSRRNVAVRSGYRPLRDCADDR